LPGLRASGPAASAEQLVNDVRQGVQDQRYRRGMIFPNFRTLQELYRASEQEVQEAIDRLRKDRLLQLHDEYRETYFIDTAPYGPPGFERDDLARKVTQLTSAVQELTDRVQVLERQIQEGQRK